MKQDSPKEEFKEILYDSFKALGIDDFSSRLLSALQSELEEVSLGELADTTGYSLSALSTALKAMEESGLVKRFKKPKSRKVYVLMDMDITTLYTELQKKRYQQSLMPALKKIPKIIAKTALPIIGKRLPNQVATKAMNKTNVSPFIIFIKHLHKMLRVQSL